MVFLVAAIRKLSKLDSDVMQMIGDLLLKLSSGRARNPRIFVSRDRQAKRSGTASKAEVVDSMSCDVKPTRDSILCIDCLRRSQSN